MYPLSLAPATVSDLSAPDAIYCAAAAGYSLAGVRPTDPATEAPAIAEALRRSGVGLLDVEYVRLRPGRLTTEQRRTAEVAGALGARFLLVVSDDPDESATTAKLAELRERLAGTPTRPALEFMAFTQVHNLAAAVRIAGAAGTPVLVDALHLTRSGGNAAELPQVASMIGYAQLCDASAAPPAGAEAAALAQEARHERMLPGHGGLAVTRFLAALPDVPVSLEVDSDLLRARYAPTERARRVREAATALVDTSREANG